MGDLSSGAAPGTVIPTDMQTVGLDGFAGGSEGWTHSTAAAAPSEESHEVHARADRLHSWARHKSSDVQLTGAHVPLTPEQVAEIEGRSESHHMPVPLERSTVQSEKVMTTINIERYAFLDEKKKVKLYIEIEGIGEIEEKVSCEF